MPAGDNQAISNICHRAMLSSGIYVVGPNADMSSLLHCPVIHGRNDVAATAAMVPFGTGATPLTGTCTAIEPQINVIFSVDFRVEYLKPIRPKLSNLIAPAFFLNCLWMGYRLGHFYLL